MPVSGSNPAPLQLAPPAVPGLKMVPCFAPGLGSSTIGAVNIGPQTYRSRISMASCRNSGVKSIRSSMVTPCSSNGGGLVGKGCVGESCSPGTSDPGTARSSIGQTGSPVARSRT